MRKKIFLFLLFVGGIGLLGTILYFRESRQSVLQEEPVISKNESVSVAATFYPLAELARGVTGESAEVVTIIPGAVEPHDYEPTPQDILAAREADIVLMNGAGLDPWAESLREELERSGVRVIEMAEYAELIKSAEEGHKEDETAEEDEEGHGHEGGVDPHFWLDPIVARKFVASVAETLSDIDPGHADVYAKNAAGVFERLTAIDAAYQKRLSSCAKHEVIVSHKAFGYLARRYNFEAHAISGLSPEDEPTPKRIAELAELAKNRDIRYIFFETLVSPKVAETLASEIGAETLVFDPIEGVSPEDRAAGRNYFTIMEENLGNLAKAMECK